MRREGEAERYAKHDAIREGLVFVDNRKTTDEIMKTLPSVALLVADLLGFLLVIWLLASLGILP